MILYAGTGTGTGTIRRRPFTWEIWARARHVACFIRHLSDSGLSNAAVSLHLSALRTTFDRLCGLSVTADLALPRPRRVDSVPLTQPEVDRLFSAATGWREQLIVLCLAGKRMNVQEMLGIRPRDIALTRCTIRVWPGFGRDEREVRFPKRVVTLLRLACRKVEPGHYVFSGRHGPERPLTGRGLRMIASRINCPARVTRPVNANLLRCSPAPSPTVLDRFGIGPGSGSGAESVWTSSATADRAHGSHEAGGSESVLRQPAETPPDSTGRLTLTLGTPKISRNTARTPVTITVSGTLPVQIHLHGASVTEHRMGTPSVQLPRPELWQDAMKWLTREMRERLADAGTRRAVTDRILAAYLRRKRRSAARSRGWPWNTRRRPQRYRFH